MTSETYAILVSATLAGIVGIWGVLSQRSIARRRTTFDYIIGSESDGDLIKARRKFIELAKAEGGLAKWAEQDVEGKIEAQAIRTTLNEFEVISIGIQRGILDYTFYKLWYRSTAIAIWDKGAPYVMRLRERTGKQAVYSEYEALVGMLRSNKRLAYFWKLIF